MAEYRSRPKDVSVDEALREHRLRDFGMCGFREVTLTVLTDDEQTSAYRICHIWTVSGEECRSVYLLTAPTALSGTVVLLTESPMSEVMDIWLRLRTARHPLHLDQSRSRQFVLGTDFTYQDLRFWLPLSAERSTRVLLARDNVGVRVVVRRAENDHEWTTMRAAFHLPSWLPYEVDHCGRSGEVLRKYTASGIRQVQQIWTPTEMLVSRERGLYRSVMRLECVSHNIDLEKEWFEVRQIEIPHEYPISLWRERSIRLGPPC